MPCTSPLGLDGGPICVWAWAWAGANEVEYCGVAGQVSAASAGCDAKLGVIRTLVVTCGIPKPPTVSEATWGWCPLELVPGAVCEPTMDAI